jgi:hypothetical protein
LRTRPEFSEVLKPVRHCSFNHLNCYKAPDWVCLRIKGDHDIPIHFTVCVTPSSGHGFLLRFEQVVPDSHLDARPDFYPTTDTESIVRPHGDELLRTYFDVIHVSYPLLDPSRFNSEPQTGDPLLATMYNLASPFCQDTVPCFKDLLDFVDQA